MATSIANAFEFELALAEASVVARKLRRKQHVTEDDRAVLLALVSLLRAQSVEAGELAKQPASKQSSVLVDVERALPMLQSSGHDRPIMADEKSRNALLQLLVSSEEKGHSVDGEELLQLLRRVRQSTRSHKDSKSDGVLRGFTI